MDWLTIGGLGGAMLVLGAYLLNQLDWLRADDWRFPAANLAGSLLILASLYAAWNLPSALIEAAWAAVSLYGLGRRLRGQASSGGAPQG